MDYKSINDYEILYLIEDENDGYKSIMYDKYKYVMNRLCNKYLQFYSTLSIDRDDLYQEAFLGFDYAISHFDFHRDLTFYTYCILCVESKIKDYCQRLLAKKNLLLSTSISLETELYENIYLSDVISSGEDVCHSVIFNEDIKKIIDFKNSLSVRQAQIFELRMNGFSYKEIATLLSIDVKGVYNHLRSIKTKYNNSL